MIHPETVNCVLIEKSGTTRKRTRSTVHHRMNTYWLTVLRFVTLNITCLFEIILKVETWLYQCFVFAVNGGLSLWSPWTKCDKICGATGKERRQRTCTNPKPRCGGKRCDTSVKTFEERLCNYCPGDLLDWGNNWQEKGLIGSSGVLCANTERNLMCKSFQP